MLKYKQMFITLCMLIKCASIHAITYAVKHRIIIVQYNKQLYWIHFSLQTCEVTYVPVCPISKALLINNIIIILWLLLITSNYVIFNQKNS